MNIAFENEIRQRAYEIWMASGRTEGEAEAHWLHAERIVRTETMTVSTAAAAKGKAKPAKAAAGASKTAADGVKTKTIKTKTAAKTTAAKATVVPRRLKAGPLEAVV